MKDIRSILVAIGLASLLPSAALANSECQLFEGFDMTGKQVSLSGSAADHGQWGNPDLEAPAAGKFKSVWIRDGYALQTFLGTYFHPLSVSGLGLYDSRAALSDPTWIKSNGGYYKNLIYPWNSEAIASARCHVSAKQVAVALGGLTSAYSLDFFSGSDFTLSSGDREWSLDMTIRETTVDGKPVVAIDHIYKQFPITNGGPSHNQTTSRHFAVNLDSGEITLNYLSSTFPGQVILPVGTTAESTLAYDAALGQINKILDFYMSHAPAKAELRGLTNLLRSVQTTPYLPGQSN